MADFNIRPVATEIKPIQGMSLGEMVNMARGAQEYQQAGQMNPLALQIRQLEAQRAQETTPSEIARVQSLGRQQQNVEKKSDLDLQSAYAEKAMGAASALSYSKAFQPDEQGKFNPAAMKQELDTIKRVLKYQGVPEHSDGTLNQLDKMIDTDPAQAAQFASNLVRVNASPEQRFQAALPSLQTVSGQPRIFTPQTAQVSTPTGFQAPAAQATASTPTVGNMKLPYPVRSASQPYLPEPTESADQTAGQTYRNGLVSRQSTLSTDMRNVDETIAQAEKLAKNLLFPEGGIRGDIERKIRTAVASDEYKMLAKDLANLQISNLRALGQGGNTVAGMDLTKVASGDETVPPDVLVKIARRVKSDLTNIDMQANGAEAFKNKYGDNNMNAYKQLWNANADSKIFEVMNIYKDVSDPTKRKFEIDKLLGSDPKKRQEFYNKYQNIKKLSETGGL